jgi:hypothetical protein
MKSEFLIITLDVMILSWHPTHQISSFRSQSWQKTTRWLMFENYPGALTYRLPFQDRVLMTQNTYILKDWKPWKTRAGVHFKKDCLCVTEHHKIPDICHDLNEIDYRVCFKRALKVFIKSLARIVHLFLKAFRDTFNFSEDCQLEENL